MKKCDKCNRLGIIKKCGDMRLFLLYKEYLRELIDQESFLICNTKYSVYNPCKDENGFWIDDGITYSIQCPECKIIYSLSADTYHGLFSFQKDR
ncbi:MAG: hypothetical protein GX802_01625 [Clostridiales bacterium]|jgi:hypothetical protein|nr:hypothetical protein [Clostridiales bacterium]